MRKIILLGVVLSLVQIAAQETYVKPLQQKSRQFVEKRKALPEKTIKISHSKGKKRPVAQVKIATH